MLSNNDTSTSRVSFLA